MPIQNMPATLQAAIQLGYLERAFQAGLRSKMAYSEIADQETFPTRRGETITKTRRGLKTPITTPMDPSTNTNFDNGLTPSTYSIEQYTLAINQYADTSDVNPTTSSVAIVPLMMQEQEVIGIQAGQSLEWLSRNSIFNTYNGGNSWVTATLGSPGVTVEVDDIRKFDEVSVSGKLVTVSVTNTRNVVIGDNTYIMTGVTADVTNTSLLIAQGGISGTLTLSTSVTVADATLKNPVVAAFSPVIIRPNARATYTDLVSTDTLTIRTIRDAVAVLRNNSVPAFASGHYNMYLDQDSMNGLYLDSDFKEIFSTRNKSSDYVDGYVGSISGVDFFVTTEAFQQDYDTGSSTLRIHRPIVCGKGALIRGNFEGMSGEAKGTSSENVIVKMVNNIAFTIRPPLDRLGQIYALSWFWIGGFTVPTDTTTTAEHIPTATSSYYKRAVVIECV